MRKTHHLIALGLTLLALAGVQGCRGQQTADQPPAVDTGRKSVYVVNYPLKYFAERIAGGSVDVVFPVPADVDPAHWQPDEAEIADFQNADLTLLNGANYAQWVARASLPDSRLVDTSRPYAGNLIEVEDAVIHSHGPGGEHSHQGVASHTWLDPRLALLQAEQVADALKNLLPEQRAKFDENLQSLQADLESLDQSLTEVSDAYHGRPLLASHPVYHYLARRCGLALKNMHWEPNELPDAKQWQDFESLLQQHPARWMIWEASPIEEIENKLSVLDVHPVVFYPCGNAPEEGDYLKVMRQNIERLRAIAEPEVE